MTFTDYQRAALRTSRAEPPRERILVQTLGLAGESGELANKVKKWAWHGKALTAADVSDELGDVLWYLSDIASAYGLNLCDVALGNIRKLEARYPDGFTADGGRRS
jgi:NTP pyrophosphatase (non-canonical NTP hydrolase)